MTRRLVPFPTMLSTAEVAARALTSPAVVRAAIAAGQLAGHRIGTAWFVAQHDAEVWIERRLAG